MNHELDASEVYSALRGIDFHYNTVMTHTEDALEAESTVATWKVGEAIKELRDMAQALYLLAFPAVDSPALHLRDEEPRER